METELSLSVSCRGMDQHWTAIGAESLGAAVLSMALVLLEEIAINWTREPPELTLDWGNRLLEGTNRILCTPGPRRKESDLHKRLTKMCP